MNGIKVKFAAPFQKNGISETIDFPFDTTVGSAADAFKISSNNMAFVCNNRPYEEFDTLGFIKSQQKNDCKLLTIRVIKKLIGGYKQYSLN